MLIIDTYELLAALAAYWMDRRPADFRAFRAASGELRGYTACFDLTEADLGVDPGVDAMWWPVAPGERVRAWRFFLDREHGQRPSPSLTLFVASQMLDLVLLDADTAWTMIAAYGDAARWGPALAFLDC